MQRIALCRSRRELSNAYLLAKFGFDTASRTSPPKSARGPPARQGGPPELGRRGSVRRRARDGGDGQPREQLRGPEALDHAVSEEATAATPAPIATSTVTTTATTIRSTTATNSLGKLRASEQLISRAPPSPKKTSESYKVFQLVDYERWRASRVVC